MDRQEKPLFSPVTDLDSISQLLEKLTVATDDPLPLLVQLFDLLRPDNLRDRQQAVSRWRRMLHLLEIPRYHDGLRSALLHLFAQRSQFMLYTESGLLPNTGFFSELRRKMAHTVLPELIDQSDLRDCLRLIFHRRTDGIWLNHIADEDKIAFWRLLTPLSCKVMHQIAESAKIIARRICAMGLETELLRVIPSLWEAEHSPFTALNDELLLFMEHLDDEEQIVTELDKKHLLVLIDQCNGVVQQLHRHATATAGTSMSLTFQLTRLEQHLKRLEHLIEILAVKVETLPEEQVVIRWCSMMVEIVQQEMERNSLRRHFAELLGRVSLLVTKNVARTGGHYIMEGREQWFDMLQSAAGAGCLIALMALVKAVGYNLHLPILYQGLYNGTIYAGGFVIIYLLHFTIATKQPAMTAAAIAGTISQSSGRLKEQGRLVELIVTTARSQFAAVVGNISLAFPVALFIGGFMELIEHDPISPEKALILLGEIHPFSSLALLYAAIAGLWLFVAGLVSGYVDNMAAYSQLGPRVACLGWLRGCVGDKWAAKVGDYLSNNAGGLAGNIFFGLMLGLTPAVGYMLRLPFDIRHVTFSAANLGYALLALEEIIPNIRLIAFAMLGVLLIGLVNLLTSFSLALWVAMCSRGARFSSALSLLPLLRQRFATGWRDFFLPEREEGVAGGDTLNGNGGGSSHP